MVTNVSGTFTGGETFKLVNAAVYSGAFSTVTLPALGPNLVWNTNQLNTAGIINVVNTAPQRRRFLGRCPCRTASLYVRAAATARRTDFIIC